MAETGDFPKPPKPKVISERDRFKRYAPLSPSDKEIVDQAYSDIINRETSYHDLLGSDALQTVFNRQVDESALTAAQRKSLIHRLRRFFNQ